MGSHNNLLLKKLLSQTKPLTTLQIFYFKDGRYEDSEGVEKDWLEIQPLLASCRAIAVSIINPKLREPGRD